MGTFEMYFIASKVPKKCEFEKKIKRPFQKKYKSLVQRKKREI